MGTSEKLLDEAMEHPKPKSWEMDSFGEVVQINPKESLPKGTVVKSIPMECLQPFTRKVKGYQLKGYTGGSKFRNNDTIMARITPCLENGKTARVTVLDEDEVGCGSTEFIVMRSVDGLSDSLYIYYFSISPQFREISIKAMNGSSGRQRVQNDVLALKKFLFPPVSEQIRIGNLLGSIDDKIELLREQNETLEALTQTLFKRWFIDFNFPDENGNPYKDSGGNVDELEETRLDSFVDLNPIEKIDRQREYLFFDMKCLPLNELSLQSGIFKKSSSGTSFREGDTLLAKITPCLENGKTGLVQDLKGEDLARGSTEFIVMRPRSNGSKCFTYCLARSSKFRDYAIRSMSGSSGRQRVPVDRVRSYSVINRPELIKIFEGLVASSFEKIKVNTQQVATLNQLRDTLLPKLMKGEIRIKEEEI